MMTAKSRYDDKFRQVASLYPEQPAIVFQGVSMSYAELDSASDEIASELSACGIGAGSIVPVRREMSADWIAFSLGILKTGAAYAPVSLSTPTERYEYILRDCETHPAPPGAFAVYYTSGSTGVPKGVILSHEGVLSLCEAHADIFSFLQGVKGGVQADPAFDSFLLSTLPVLYAGGTLYLMNEAERVSLTGIHRFLMRNKIDITFMTTQLATEYMRSFDNKYLKFLLTGGEALRGYTTRSYDVYNIYGPTECTAYVTTHKLRTGYTGDIPIGAPIGRNIITVVDGEICVSGPQVALGYLGHPPFTQPYHTGDLGEWTADGELLCRGRMDNMVKISGYRIEPGEVEAVLSRHPHISAARVVTRHTPEGEPFLSAYYVPCSEDVSLDRLKGFLLQSLPQYMLPKKFTRLTELPVDARTGKVDTSALE